MACLSALSLSAALEGGRKTLAIGASKAGCEFAIANPSGTILLERGILPAIELGHGKTDEWAVRLLESGCRVLLNAEIEKIERVQDGFEVVAYGTDGRHVFKVDNVKDFTLKGWHKGEWR